MVSLFPEGLKLSSFAPGLNAIAANSLFGSTTSAGSRAFSVTHEIISMVEKSNFLVFSVTSSQNLGGRGSHVPLLLSLACIRGPFSMMPMYLLCTGPWLKPAER